MLGRENVGRENVGRGNVGEWECWGGGRDGKGNEKGQGGVDGI
jgi:hypothetical protein